MVASIGSGTGFPSSLLLPILPQVLPLVLPLQTLASLTWSARESLNLKEKQASTGYCADP